MAAESQWNTLRPETQVDSEHHIWAEKIHACDVSNAESAVVVSWCNTSNEQRLPLFAYPEDPHERYDTQVPEGLIVELIRREVAE